MNAISGLGRLLSDLLKGTHLNGQLIVKHFPFLLFLAVLAFFAIRSAHKAEYKVIEIGTLKTEVKDLESEYIETKSLLMQLSMESKVVARAEGLGLKKNAQPPKKVTETSKK
ncbi:MAG: S-adenosyl-methyltransferase [Schleiferiaceae bacterium]|nr:S-adenosyl-methyltransferase [Schleiferiaceae bacterium]